jgi:hypothetical protein
VKHYSVGALSIVAVVLLCAEACHGKDTGGEGQPCTCTANCDTFCGYTQCNGPDPTYACDGNLICAGRTCIAPSSVGEGGQCFGSNALCSDGLVCVSAPFVPSTCERTVADAGALDSGATSDAGPLDSGATD